MQTQTVRLIDCSPAELSRQRSLLSCDNLRSFTRHSLVAEPSTSTLKEQTVLPTQRVVPCLNVHYRQFLCQLKQAVSLPLFL